MAEGGPAGAVLAVDPTGLLKAPRLCQGAALKWGYCLSLVDNKQIHLPHERKVGITGYQPP